MFDEVLKREMSPQFKPPPGVSELDYLQSERVKILRDILFLVSFTRYQHTPRTLEEAQKVV